MLIQDAYNLLAQNGTGGIDVSSSVVPGMMSVLQVEPEDSVEMVCAVLRLRTNPVAIVLPEKGAVFGQSDHFVRLRQILGEDAEGTISFVIPPARLHTLARLAYEQGFSFSSSLGKLIEASLQQVHPISGNGEGELPLPLLFSSHAEFEITEEIPVQIESNGEEDNQKEFALTATEVQALPFTPISDLSEPHIPPSSFSSHAVTGKSRSKGKRLAFIAVPAVLLAIVLPILFLARPLVSLFPAHSTSKISLPTSQVGTLSFTSSEQVDPTSSRGLNDQISLTMNQLPQSDLGTRYYAWLLPDTADDKRKPLLLGALNVRDGRAHLDYRSPDHANLLATFSRFRLTEQSSSSLPILPSADPNTWRDEGGISSTPTPGDEKQYSLLSHMRHLLANDPTLTALGLSGGLAIWLYRNTGKLVEYTSAARDDWGTKGATDLMHRQIIRILDYLDGLVYVWRDVPAGTPFLVDPKAARIGLLEMTMTQNPPGYLAHVDIHLQGLANSPGHTDAQHLLAIQIDQAVNTTMVTLQNLRNDAVQLAKMDATHLKQPHTLALIDDMVINATASYAGHTDPSTGENTGGIIWIYNKIQGLAVMPITGSSQRK